jgi:hypothetical protein
MGTEIIRLSGFFHLASPAKLACKVQVRLAPVSGRRICEAGSRTLRPGVPNDDRHPAIQEAGADVLQAPGLATVEDIRSLATSVDRPVNCLIMPGGPSATEIFEAGAARISTGSAIAVAAQAAIVESARELLDQGTHAFFAKALPAMGTVMGAMESGD